MSAIYAEATDMIIWLGLSDIEEQHIEWLLEWNKDENGIFKIRRQDIYTPLVHSVKALWRNEYWASAWIVHEVTLARSATIVT